MAAALTACDRLREADAAWHALNSGASLRSVTDENGERIEFSVASRAGLLTYIRSLQQQCDTYVATALGGVANRPVKFLF